MNPFLWLKKLFSGEKPPPLTPEELRRVFKIKYHAFRLLLAANNMALRLMTDMEAALSGKQSFGMTFVRSHVTGVCVNVYNIIKHLNELAPDKYLKLEPVFEGIREKIESVLKSRYTPPPTALVLPLEAVTKEMADGVGTKMANLGEIRNRLPDLLVPGGFAITAGAYARFLAHNHLEEEINRLIQSLEVEDISDLYRKSSEIQMHIIGAELPPELTEAIGAAYERLEAEAGAGVRVALRSSAIGEDALDTSFAGQYRSELNISRANILQAFKEIIASKYALTAVSYRLNKGLRDEDVAMCVGCMAMVDAAAGGVMYSRDPMNIRSDTISINGVHGLAKSVVDGSVSPDLWVVSRPEPLAIIKKEIRDKKQKVVCLPEEGVYQQEDPEAKTPALTDEQALALARLALVLEEHFGSPQDIEWSIDRQGRIFILQSRPLKQLTQPSRDEAAAPSAVDHPVILRGGELASPGVAAGPAFLVRNNVDLLRFPEGAVLVASYSHPSWATLLSRARAVITDRGGVTGHLANVAREFGIPALFNTGDATQRLETGQMITVDADGHAVYQGRVESLLQAFPEKRGLMQGTPVYEALKEVMAHITPLNLTNPEAPEFKAQKCRTLHDITRFAHEVSVKEMFYFDQKAAFASQAIKRLKADVPMEWWVLNLEDGFKAEVPGKEVELENIASIPMLALWQGITAVPWEGPPPVDMGGFMSIVLESAAGRDVGGADTPFGNRNYFMISKYFCNLTSRLGYHFSTVEALCGESLVENYVRFAFKGGAADLARRVYRTEFVGKILERFDFKVDMKDDSLFARLEGESMDFILARLRILGYVTIHTRQLDMIMLRDDEVQRYFDKMIKDIETVILPGSRS